MLPLAVVQSWSPFIKTKQQNVDTTSCFVTRISLLRILWLTLKLIVVRQVRLRTLMKAVKFHKYIKFILQRKILFCR
jgi:hypothetical protein